MEPVHFSNLRHIARSPAHYRAALTERAETRNMRIGSAVHAMVLGGDFVVWEGDRRGASWREFYEENKDRLILTSSEHEISRATANSVLACEMAVEVLAGTDKEVPLEWEWMGRPCAGRLDAMAKGKVVELKTSFSSAPGRFQWHAYRMSYHAQLAWYLRGSGQEETGEGYIIAVEPAPPYAVTVFHCTSDLISAGDRLCRLWMERLLSCEAENEWPPYVQGVIPLDLPQEQDDLSLMIGDEEVAL